MTMSLWDSYIIIMILWHEGLYYVLGLSFCFFSKIIYLLESSFNASYIDVSRWDNFDRFLSIVLFSRLSCLWGCICKVAWKKFEWNKILLLRIDVEIEHGQGMGVFIGFRYIISLSDEKFQGPVSRATRGTLGASWGYSSGRVGTGTIEYSLF